MNNKPMNICPLMGRPCLEGQCAWFHDAINGCALAAIADNLEALREAADDE